LIPAVLFLLFALLITVALPIQIGRDRRREHIRKVHALERSLRDRLFEVPRTTLAEGQEGLVRVEGRITPLDGPLAAPVSGRRGAAFVLTATVVARGRRVEPIAALRRNCRFAIADGTGQATVEGGGGVELHVAPADVRRGRTSAPALLALLEARGVPIGANAVSD
jgi:hypothetical protein